MEQTRKQMKTAEEVLNENRTKYNKSLSDEENMTTLKRNHDENIITPDDCYKAMKAYAELALLEASGRVTIDYDYLPSRDDMQASVNRESILSLITELK